MTFLAPSMLWLLPLGLLPVVFHLFFRVRRQPRAFSSLMFFLAVDPRLGMRRKIREWLLLALRCLLLLALLLALARPVRPGRGAAGITLVAVIDNSASMQAAGRGGERRLTRAAAAAAALFEDEAVSFAGLVTTVRDPLAAMPASVTGDRASLLAALAAIRPTQAAGDPSRALAAAIAAVRGALRSAGEVHLLTDLQASEWRVGDAPLDLPPAVTLIVHDVGGDGDQAGCVGLAALRPPARPPLAGRAWSVGVTVRNLGGEPAEVVLHALEKAGGEHIRETVRLAAGAERDVPLTFRSRQTGGAQVRVWLEGQAAAPVAEGWLDVPPSDGVAVVLAGSPADYGLLAPALSPTGDGALTGIRVSAAEAEALAARLESPPRPALVAVTPSLLAQSALAGPLHAFVKAGGRLLVAPGVGRLISQPALPGWCGAAWGETYQNEAGGDWRILAADAAIWDELRGPDGEPLWRGILAYRGVRLRVDRAQAVAGLATGEPLLARHAVDRGEVIVSGVAWDSAWSTLPHKAAFLALVQGLALSGRTAGSVPPVIAGAALPGATATNQATEVEIQALAGGEGHWRLMSDDPRLPVRAGIYQIGTGALARRVSVMGDLREAAPARVTGGAVPRLGTTPHLVIREANAAARLKAVQSQRRGRSLFGPLLLVAVAALLLEAVAGEPRHSPGTSP